MVDTEKVRTATATATVTVTVAPHDWFSFSYLDVCLVVVAVPVSIGLVYWGYSRLFGGQAADVIEGGGSLKTVIEGVQNQQAAPESQLADPLTSVVAPTNIPEDPSEVAGGMAEDPLEVGGGMAESNIPEDSLDTGGAMAESNIPEDSLDTGGAMAESNILEDSLDTGGGMAERSASDPSLIELFKEASILEKHYTEALNCVDRVVVNMSSLLEKFRLGLIQATVEGSPCDPRLAKLLEASGVLEGNFVEAQKCVRASAFQLRISLEELGRTSILEPHLQRAAAEEFYETVMTMDMSVHTVWWQRMASPEELVAMMERLANMCV
jgi:hypothetical protein